ncbi:hypothetical protein RM863_35230 [Streptomyces sp. DSM 41014]|uniref:Uncharacterized protein n=1 Tax=Streptomyces hintoniae TaxID=3075521 RepID=A0ABU2UW77_9ACTN|nr:hypothetical protein [Streptomyces sp. DSM 41014]MDT0477388.1 hypothetical protein [Streptomyces sp. DSM 41014]
MSAPERGTREYEWWSAGAHAEAAARKEGRSAAGLNVLSLVDAFAEHHHGMSETEIAGAVLRIYGVPLPLRERLRLAARILRGAWR